MHPIRAIRIQQFSTITKNISTEGHINSQFKKKKGIYLFLQLAKIHPWLFKKCASMEQNNHVSLCPFYKIFIPWDNAPLRKVLSGHVILCMLSGMEYNINLKCFFNTFPMEFFI